MLIYAQDWSNFKLYSVSILVERQIVRGQFSFRLETTQCAKTLKSVRARAENQLLFTLYVLCFFVT